MHANWRVQHWEQTWDAVSYWSWGRPALADIEVVDLTLGDEDDDEATLGREEINHNDNRSGPVGASDGIMIHVQPDDEIPELGESVEFGDTLGNSNVGLFRTSTLSKTSTVSTENLPHLCLMLPLTRIWKSLQKSPSHRIFALQYLSDITGDYQAHWTLHTLRYKSLRASSPLHGGSDVTSQ